MTRALRDTTAYINCCIRDMNRHVDHLKEKAELDAKTKREWALHRIEEECSQAFGALQLAYIYLEEIEEKDRDALEDILIKAKNEAMDRVWKEI